MLRRDRVIVYRDVASDWRWRYVAQNSHVMADSGQGYSRRIDCMRAARRVVGLRPRLVAVVVEPEGVSS